MDGVPLLQPGVSLVAASVEGNATAFRLEILSR